MSVEARITTDSRPVMMIAVAGSVHIQGYCLWGVCWLFRQIQCCCFFFSETMMAVIMVVMAAGAKIRWWHIGHFSEARGPCCLQQRLWLANRLKLHLIAGLLSASRQKSIKSKSVIRKKIWLQLIFSFRFYFSWKLSVQKIVSKLAQAAAPFQSLAKVPLQTS